MDRIINVKISGNHLTKDSNNAGTRGEANVTILRITFGEEWAGYAKSITFIDAYGMNPTKLTLTADLLENRAESSLIYLVPIPKEPLRIAGDMTFSIEGWTNGKRQRAVSDTLEVKDAPITDDVDEPTPTQVEQMQNQYEAIMGDIQNTARYRNEAETFAENAEKAQERALQAKASAEQTASEVSHTIEIAEGVADRLIKQSIQEAAKASVSAEDAEEHANRAENAVGKTSYIGENGNWYAWDGKKEEFYDTGIRAQAGSEVYVGDNPPASADVWINPNGDESDVLSNPDYKQNDSTKLNYIKNRPFYEEIISTENTSVALKFNVTEIEKHDDCYVAYASYRADSLGLMLGQTYGMKLKGYKGKELILERDILTNEYDQEDDPELDVVHKGLFSIPRFKHYGDEDYFDYDEQDIDLWIEDMSSSDYYEKAKETDIERIYARGGMYVNTSIFVGDCDRYELILTGNFSYVKVYPIAKRYIGEGSVGIGHLNSQAVRSILMRLEEGDVPDTIARVADVDKKIADSRLAYDEFIETNESASLRFQVKAVDENGIAEAEYKGTNLGLRAGQTYGIKLKGYKDTQGYLNGEVVFEKDVETTPSEEDHEDIGYLIGFGEVRFIHFGDGVELDIWDATSIDSWEYLSNADSRTARGTLEVDTDRLAGDCGIYEIILTGNFGYVKTNCLPNKYIGDNSIGYGKLNTSVTNAILRRLTDEHIPDTIARKSDLHEPLAYEDTELICSVDVDCFFDAPAKYNFSSELNVGDKIIIEVDLIDGTVGVGAIDYVKDDMGLLSFIDTHLGKIPVWCDNYGACIEVEYYQETWDQGILARGSDTFRVKRVIMRQHVPDRFISDTIARKTETIPMLPVGTQIMEFDGGFSDGFYGDKKMFALQEGDYFISENKLTIKEQGICWARRDVYYMFITFICESGIKFFDYIDIYADGEYSTDEPYRELPFANAESILTFSSVEDYSTTFSCMHLMSPSGNAYTVTVDDDGQLITTPHD